MTEHLRIPEPVRSPRLDRTLAAAARLLGDESPFVARAARAYVVAAGVPGRDELARASEDGCARTRMRARAILRSFEVEACLKRFTGLELDGSGWSGPAPLLDGAVYASHMVRTFAPEASELRRTLEREADVLRARFAGRSLNVCARLLSEHLHGELGFRGGDASCLDLDHVLLDRVVEGRTGVPVSLSLVYLLVARWAGLSVSGVGMPEHFLVRLHGVRPVLVDPFYGGRTVTKVDCTRYLKSLGYDQVRDHLRDLSDRELLAYYLRELRRAAGYRGRRDAQRTLGDALFHLDPN
ncbi:MAG: transglutaminase-like domain-containing protein [Planctomycetota bacterium]